MAKNEYFIKVGAELDQASIDGVYETLQKALSKDSRKFDLSSPKFANKDEFKKQIVEVFDASGEVKKVFASLELAAADKCDHTISVVLNKLKSGKFQIDKEFEDLASHGAHYYANFNNAINSPLKTGRQSGIVGVYQSVVKSWGKPIADALLNSIKTVLPEVIPGFSAEAADELYNGVVTALKNKAKSPVQRKILSEPSSIIKSDTSTQNPASKKNNDPFGYYANRLQAQVNFAQTLSQKVSSLDLTDTSAAKSLSEEYDKLWNKVQGIRENFQKKSEEIGGPENFTVKAQQSWEKLQKPWSDVIDILDTVKEKLDEVGKKNQEVISEAASISRSKNANKTDANQNPFAWYNEIAKKQLESSNKLVNNINSIASTDASAINRMDKSASSQHNAIEESRTQALTRLDELGGTAKLSEEQVKAWEDLNNIWARAEANISNATSKLLQFNLELRKSAAAAEENKSVAGLGKAVGQNVNSGSNVTYLPGVKEQQDKDDIRRVNMLYAQYEQTLLEIEHTQRNIVLMQEQGQDTSNSRIALQAAQDQLNVIEDELSAYQNLYNEKRLVLLQDKVANQISKESRQILQTSEKNEQSTQQTSDLNTLLRMQRSLWADIVNYKTILATADAQSFQAEAAQSALDNARSELDLIQEKIASSDAYGAEEKQRAAQEIANAKEVSAIRQQTIKDGAALDKIAAKEATTVAQEAERGFKNAERLQQTVNKLQSQFDDQQVRAGALNVGPENLSGLDDGIKSINTDLQEYRKLLSEGNIGQAKILWDDITNSVTLTDQAVKDLNESLSQVEASHSRLDELAKKAYAAQATAGSIGGYSIRQEDGNVVQAELNERAALAVQLYREELDRLGYTEEEWLSRNNGVNAANEARAKALSDVTLAIKKQEEEQRRLNDTAEASQVAAFQKQIGDYLKNNTLLSEANKSSIQDMLRSISASAGNLTRTELEQMSQKFNEIRINAKATGKEGTDAFTKIGNAFQKFGGWSLVTRSLTYARRLLVQLPKDVKELESALANFSIVTGATGDRLNRLADSAYDAAQKTKSSVTDVLDAATVYARLGFSDTDSVLYSQLTAMFSKVGNVDVSDAENAVTAMIKAFDLKTSELELALDKMVAVGNNAPISAAQLGEGFNNAAAALSASGNTLEQSIGMLTAANATLQNASQASTALRTITARIRNSKADLEELGESTDDLATSTAKYRQDIMSLTGVDIMANENDFKSTYEILDELADKWEHLSDINKASVTTLVAGTRQQAVFASLMQNWDEARKAVELCDEAGGTMNDNYSKYTKTIEARITGLKTSFSQFANTLLNSDIISFFVSAADSVVKFATALSKVNALVPAVASGWMTAKNTGFVKTYRGLDGSIFTQNIFERKLSNDDVAALKSYNEAVKSISNSQEIAAESAKAYTKYLSNASPAAKQAAVAANGAAVSIETLTAAENAATVASKVLWAALKNFVIVTVITLALKGLMWIIDQVKEAVRPAEDRIKDLSDAMKNLSEHASETASEFKELKIQTDDILPKYKQLAKGVDQFGKNVSLSDDEYKEFIDLQNQLAELFPDLLLGYDENGNAILTMSNNVDVLTESLTNYLEVERQIANQKIADTLPDAFKNAIDQQKQYTKLINDTESYIESVTDVYDTLKNITAETPLQIPNYGDMTDTFKKYYDYFGINLRADLESDTYIVELKDLPQNLADKYKAIVDSAQQKIDAYNNRNKHNWAKLNPILSAWLSTDFSFQELEDDQQRAVLSFVSQLDWTEAGVKTAEQAEDFITNNILNVFTGAGVSADIQNAFTQLLTLDPSKITVGQYQSYIETLISYIQQAIQNKLIDSDIGEILTNALTGSLGNQDYDVDVDVDDLTKRFTQNQKSFENAQDIYAERLLQLNQYKEAYQSAVNDIEYWSQEYNNIVNGNVDYSKRPIISPEEMIAAGWTDFEEYGNDIATTFTQGFVEGLPGKEVSFEITPILEDGRVLSPQALSNYISTLLFNGDTQSLLKSDRLNLVVDVVPGVVPEQLWKQIFKTEKLGDIKDEHYAAVLDAQNYKGLIDAQQTVVDQQKVIAENAASELQSIRVSTEDVSSFLSSMSVDEFNKWKEWDASNGSDYTVWDEYKQAYLDYVDTVKSEFNFELWFASFEKLSDLRSATLAAMDDMGTYGHLQTKTFEDLQKALNAHGLDLDKYLSTEGDYILANTDLLQQYWIASTELNAEDYVDDLENVNGDLKVALAYQKQLTKELKKQRQISSFTNLNNATADIGVLHTASNELDNDGGISYDTLSSISEKFNEVDGIKHFIDVLTNAKEASEETAEIISSLLYASLTKAFGSTEQLANADESLVAKMLEQEGVANSVAAAHEILAKAKNDSAVVSKLLTASTQDDIVAILNEAGAADTTAQYLVMLAYKKAALNLSTVSTSGDIANLQALATQAGMTGDALSTLATLKANLSTAEERFANATDPRGKADAMAQIKSIQTQMGDLVSTIQSDAASLPVTVAPSINFANAGGGGGGASTAADNIMESYNNLNAVLEHCIRLQEENYTVAERNYNYDGMKASLQEQVNYYKKIQEAAHTAAEQLRNYYRSQGMDAATIEQQSDIMGLSETWISAAGSIRDTLDKMASAIRESLSAMIDDVQSAWDSLSKAAEEYTDTGTISVDTLQEIISSGIEYVALLKEENGQLVLNDDAIADVLEAKTQQLAIESALGYIQEVRNALTEQNTNELQRLLDVTQMTTDSTWGLVDAQLASLRASGLSDEQYNQLVSNINKFRSVADTSIKSIRTQIKNSRDDTLKNTKDALDDMLKYVEDMIKWEHDKMIEAIEDESDAYQDLIDKKKELLQETKNENDYEKEVAKQLKEISKIQNQINLLSLDDSREGKAKKAELEQQLAELQTGLTDYISDYTLQKNEETLDKSSEDYQKYNEDRIKAIQDEISSEQKLYELALDRIDSEYETLLSQVLAYNREAGNSIEEDIVKGWDNAIAAIRQYGSYAEAVAGVGAAMSLGEYNSYSSVGDVGNTNVDAQATDIVSKMKANSAAWHNASDADKAKLDAENVMLASQLEAIINKKLVRSRGGTWYIGSESGPTLYSVYHSGGVVGDKSNIKQDETLALLQNGEMVTTKKMQNTLFSMVDFIDSVSAKLRAMTNGNSITSLLSNNTSVLKSLQPAIAGASSSFVFEPHIEVNITSNGPMSDDEVRGYGEQIANTTLSKLSEAFTKKGMNSFGAALLRG